jgi:hypothetical protein
MSGMTNEEVLKYLPERYHAIYENCFPAPRPEIQDDRNWFPQICVDFASARKEFEELKAQVMQGCPVSTKGKTISVRANVNFWNYATR